MNKRSVLSLALAIVVTMTGIVTPALGDEIEDLEVNNSFLMGEYAEPWLDEEGDKNSIREDDEHTVINDEAVEPELSSEEMIEEELEVVGALEKELITDGSDEEELDLVSASLPQPATITGLYNSKNGGDLRWKAQDSAEKYVIYRTNAGKTIKIATVDGKATSYMDTSIKDNCWGKVYVYYVFSQIGKNISKRGEGKTLQRLAPMDISSLKNDKDNTATITWKISTGTNKANGYEVQYALSKDDLFNQKGSFKKVAVDGRNNLKTEIAGLSKNQTYYFRIRAFVNYTHSVTKVTTKTWSQYSDVKNLKIVKGRNGGTFDFFREKDMIFYLHDEQWVSLSHLGWRQTSYGGYGSSSVIVTSSNPAVYKPSNSHGVTFDKDIKGPGTAILTATDQRTGATDTMTITVVDMKKYEKTVALSTENVSKYLNVGEHWTYQYERQLDVWDPGKKETVTQILVGLSKYTQDKWLIVGNSNDFAVEFNVEYSDGNTDKTELYTFSQVTIPFPPYYHSVKSFKITRVKGQIAIIDPQAVKEIVNEGLDRFENKAILIDGSWCVVSRS